MKMSFFEKKNGRDCSFFKITYSELPKFIDILKQLLDQVACLKGDETTPLLARSQFRNLDDRKNPDYFSPEHTLYTDSKKLCARQHKNMEGLWTIKILQPKQTEFEDWLGSTCTLSIGHCKEFIEHLTKCRQFIDQQIYIDSE